MSKPEYSYSMKRNGIWKVEDKFGTFVSDLTVEQADKVRDMVNRAFQVGFDECGAQIRSLINA